MTNTTIKADAKRLASAANEIGIDIKHTHALEILARMGGSTSRHAAIEPAASTVENKHTEATEALHVDLTKLDCWNMSKHLLRMSTKALRSFERELSGVLYHRVSGRDKIDEQTIETSTLTIPLVEDGPIEMNAVALHMAVSDLEYGLLDRDAWKKDSRLGRIGHAVYRKMLAILDGGKPYDFSSLTRQDMTNYAAFVFNFTSDHSWHCTYDAKTYKPLPPHQWNECVRSLGCDETKLIKSTKHMGPGKSFAHPICEAYDDATIIENIQGSRRAFRESIAERYEARDTASRAETFGLVAAL